MSGCSASGRGGIKTDDRDAEALARASYRNPELPSVHLRSELSRQRKEALNARRNLLEVRKLLSLSIKSWLRSRLLLVKGRAKSAYFAEAVRRVALEHPEGLPFAIEQVLVSYEHLCEQIDQLDEEVKRLVAEDEVCQRLMTVPGVGPVVALAFTTQLDTPDRFATSETLSSYLALSPGEATTGGKVVRTGTLRAGPLHLKSLLVQGAWSAWRSRPNDPMVVWARSLAERRGSRIAIVALARKLATILWSMWKHQTTYDPSRASTAR